MAISQIHHPIPSYFNLKILMFDLINIHDTKYNRVYLLNIGLPPTNYGTDTTDQSFPWPIIMDV